MHPPGSPMGQQKPSGLKTAPSSQLLGRPSEGHTRCPQKADTAMATGAGSITGYTQMSISGGTGRLRHSHAVDHFVTTQRDRLMIHMATRMNLHNMLKEAGHRGAHPAW